MVLVSSLAIANHPDPLHIVKIPSRISNAKTIKAFSRTKDSGLMQINCRWWWKNLKFKNIKKCRVAMLDSEVNIKAAIHILGYFRKNFKQCQGDNIYRCYNGGQGWQRSKNIKKIIHYSGKVKWRKNVLEKHYSGLINFTMLLL